MSSLLNELRSLGLRVDFAGVNMCAEERAETRRHVDRWVWDFGRSGSKGFWPRVLRRIRSVCGELPIVGGRQRSEIDSRFLDHWADEVRYLQRRERYGVVLVAYVFYSAFLEQFPERCLKIIDTHDVFAHRAERLREKGVENFWFSVSSDEERKGLLRANLVLAIQDQERDHFLDLIGKEATEVVTVGHFQKVKGLAFAQNSARKVAYVASDNGLNRDAIEWFLSEVWPVVCERVPDAELHVAGSICSHVRRSEGLVLHGFVESLEDFYASALFSVNPMRAGTGLKIKTVESLCFGRSVIGLPTAFEGLEHLQGFGHRVVFNEMEFAEQMVAWLRAPDHAEVCGQEAAIAMKGYWKRNKQMLASALGMEDVNHDAKCASPHSNGCSEGIKP